MSWASAIADALFSNFRWWRRRLGGHWEHWYVNDGRNQVWLHVPRCTVGGDRPGPDCLGTPTCESHPVRNRS